MNDRLEQENPADSHPEGMESKSSPRWQDSPEINFGSNLTRSDGFRLLLIAAAFNFFVPILVRASAEHGDFSVIEPIAFGVTNGEVALLTWWLVWGPGTFVARLAMHWCAAMGLLAAFAVGMAVAMSDAAVGEFLEVVGVLFCCSPLVSLSAQLPLWPLRTHFGWRIQDEIGMQLGSFREASDPLSIRDICIGTAVVAVSLASAKLMPLGGGSPNEMFWLGWGVAVVSIAIVSAMSLIPATLLLLRSRQVGSGLAWFVAYFFAWTFAAWSFIGIGSDGRAPGEIYLAFGLAIWTYAASLAVPLLLIRGRGFRLTSPRDRRKAARATLPAEPATAIPPGDGGHPAA
jgi:hypothetical protein